MNKERLESADGTIIPIIYSLIFLEKQLQDLMEDAYAFCSSFLANKYEEEQQKEEDPSPHMDSNLLPDKLATERNLLKFYEIDFDQLSIYLKKLT
jgi:hypothetical protein